MPKYPNYPYPNYPKDPDFPEAAMTQEYALRGARIDKLEEMMHEFRKAREDRWAEWVAARTPFGDEAKAIQEWQHIRLHSGGGLSW